nr:PorP/SprF family type IX secretion system membrane protein [Saprospiraceae bacterium]
MIGFLNKLPKRFLRIGTLGNTAAAAILILFFLLPGKSTAQDMLFSQAYASPSFFNPALAGAYDALYRISVQHRNQWNAVLDNPFKTYALSGDARLEIGRDRNKRDAFSLGANFLSDRVGKLDFSKTSISLVGAFHKNLSQQNTQFLSVGFSLGMNQQNINYENIRFHDQFDGTNSYNLPTDEPLPQNNFSYADVSIGLNYSYRSSSGLRLNVGGSILHLLAPNVSFYQNSQEPQYFGETENKIHRNFIGHLSAETAISPEIWLSPRVITSFQGPHTQIYAGTGSKLLLNESYNSFLHFGIFTRVNNRLDDYKFRDLSFLVAFEIEGISLGLSYDLSMDDIKHYSQRQGIFEISLSIMGDYYNEHDLCPRF